jgi:hypothetical protein
MTQRKLRPGAHGFAYNDLPSFRGGIGVDTAGGEGG